MRLALAPLALLAAACGGNLPSFDVHASSKSTIPHQDCGLTCGLSDAFGGLTGPFGSLGSFDISSTSDFKNQGVPKSHITSVKLTAAHLVASATAAGCTPADFSFLSSLEFDVGTSGQPTVRIAHAEGPGGGAFTGTTIDLTLDDVDLAPYATADTMSITTKANGHAPTKCDVDVNAALTFHVIAHL